MNLMISKKCNRMNDKLSKPNTMKLEVPIGLTIKKTLLRFVEVMIIHFWKQYIMRGIIK